MGLLAAALLGAVQGVTEFLPVSSSAHLILARAFFGWEIEAAFGLAFDVAVHVGTLLAVVVFFRADLLTLAAAAPRLLSGKRDADVRRLWLVAIGTVPVVIVGALWADALDVVRTPAVAAGALAAGALLLFAIERMTASGRGQGRAETALSPAGAALIGCAQACALVPGVSRSGATIAAGMACGLTREAAARFTFVMSVPAILGAAAKEALALRGQPLSSADVQLFAVGLVTSAVVGYLTVRFLMRFLAAHRLDVFAWYRLALAAVTVVWLWWGAA